jgi:hypothetical protein
LNASEDVNMTLEGVGGTYERETFPVSDLIFRNETSGEDKSFLMRSLLIDGLEEIFYIGIMVDGLLFNFLKTSLLGEDISLIQVIQISLL